MYILASDFFEKTINTYLKLEIHVECREFLHQKYSKLSLKSGFSVYTKQYSFVIVCAGREY